MVLYYMKKLWSNVIALMRLITLFCALRFILIVILLNQPQGKRILWSINLQSLNNKIIVYYFFTNICLGIFLFVVGIWGSHPCPLCRYCKNNVHMVRGRLLALDSYKYGILLVLCR